jgi:hypothetical protein
LPALEASSSPKIVDCIHEIPREHTGNSTAGVEDTRPFC